jgi:hypothetical protein
VQRLQKREKIQPLPAELTAEQRQTLAAQLCFELCKRHQIAIDLAIHSPGKGGDTRNHHAHILCTTRRLDCTGFTDKSRELDAKNSGEVEYWRGRWEQLVNEALQSANLPARVDHRSHADRGIGEEPTTHHGPAKTALARRLRGPQKSQKSEPKPLTPAQLQTTKRLHIMRSRLLTSRKEQAQESTVKSKNERTKNVKKTTIYAPV